MGGSASKSKSSEKFERNSDATTINSLNIPDQFRTDLESRLMKFMPGVGPGQNTTPVGNALERIGARNGDVAGHGRIATLLNTIDPYSSKYEDETQSKYSDFVQKGLSQATSGPEAVLAPHARGKSLREAETIGQLSRDRADNVFQKTGFDMQNFLGTYQNYLNNTNQAADIWLRSRDSGGDTFANLLNTYMSRNNSLTEAITGKGSQQAAGASLGFKCCFIFLEAYNGRLPSWVRACRDEFAPESSARRHGYRRMAGWLVPLMQRSAIIRFLVNFTMIKPLTIWGGFYKKVPGYRHGWVLKPFVSFWFKTWELIGRNK